jgi:hypothetical protein
MAETPPPKFTIGNILLSAKTLSLEEAKKASVETFRSECWQQAVLWGSIVGSLFGFHRFKQGASKLQILNSIVLSGLFTYFSQYYFCRRNEYDRDLAIRAYYKLQDQRRTLPSMEEEDDEDDILSTGNTNGEALENKKWQKEISKLVQYELPQVKKNPEVESIRMR